MTRKRRDGGDTPFGDWVRGNPVFDSKAGHDFQNLDYVHHHYFDGKIQILEEKRYRAKRSFAQTDTHGVVDQFLQTGHATNSRGIDVEYCGYFVIQFENESPEDGRIWVNGRLVTEEDLYRLLSFDDDAVERFRA